ncbi:MAG: Programmed cell death toxin MazF [uncultured Sulfurovum sp.]|uniref:Programmed cell death toxin MazF n=1 Tax=uncultured Sulfurovum sp. TaxID=269237 RepID=A0A6S6UIQ9_9BACT|nr:MAG: Programmed cell death toxin MazF [uncultured Sulfurovum sp.]
MGITSKVKGYPFEVALPKGLEIEGVILSDQIKNLDYTAREIAYICDAPDDLLVNVQKNVLALVG